MGKKGFRRGVHLTPKQIRELQAKVRRKPSRSLAARVSRGDAAAVETALEKLSGNATASVDRRLELLKALGDMSEPVGTNLRRRVASILLDIAANGALPFEIRTEALLVFDTGFFWSKGLSPRFAKLVKDQSAPIDVRHTALGVIELKGSKALAKHLDGVLRMPTYRRTTQC